MAIEIRQLTIKSTVEDDDGSAARENTNLETVTKDDILRECRRLIVEMLGDRDLR